MQIGNQLEARSGYMGLQAGLRYVYLANQKTTDSVWLVLFSVMKAPRTATLVSVSRSDFEQGLLTKQITKCKAQYTLPQHLSHLEGFRPKKIDKARGKKAKILHQDIINKRLARLAPALERTDEILESKTPESLLNKIAREQHTNETRYRYEYFAYLAFGKNPYSLLPATIANGFQDQSKSVKGRRRGRGSDKHGRKYGAPLSEQAEVIIAQCYSRFQARGVHLCEIHERTMIHGFKAQTVRDENGKVRFIKRNGGLPVPTLDQFRRCVIKQFGLDTIQKNKYGRERHRRQYATSMGRFATEVSNLLEQTEEDAYYTKDCPIGVVDKSPLPPMAVHTVIDVASGLEVGIGFSSLKESAEGYNMAKFFQALPKVFACALFDISIEPYEWPSQGINLMQKRDRGPGIKREPGSGDSSGNAQVDTAIRRHTPSGQGQSKPFVESSHRRRVRHEGADSIEVSDLTPFEMARREIFKALMRNHEADMSSRMTPEMIDAGVDATPIGVWNYLNERGRNVGQEISIEDAVRQYLRDIKVSVKPDGVYIGHMRYTSDELIKSGLFSRNGKNKNRKDKCKAYVMPICVRSIWLEVDGFLIKADAQLAIKDDKAQLHQTYDDLQARNKRLNELNTKRRSEKPGISVDYINRFEKTTGKSFHSTKRMSRQALAKARAGSQDIADLRNFARETVHG